MAGLKFEGNKKEKLYSAEINNIAYANQNAVLSGCEVTASSPTAMTVEVSSGNIFYGNDEVSSSGATALAIGSAPVSDIRIDLVVVNNSGTVSVIAGTAGAEPMTPDYDPDTYIVLAMVTVATGTTTITDDEIKDVRILNVGGSGSGGGTFGRDVTSFTAQTSVTVTHNLGDDEPIVSIYNSSDELIEPATLTIVDTNSFTVTFGVATTGKIVTYGGTGMNNGYYSKTYTAATTWTVTHNLDNKFVMIKCYDSSDNEITPSNILLDSDSQATITWGSSTAGTVVVTGGVSSMNLDACTDVNITSVTDKDILQYNSATSKWENTQGGGLTKTITYSDLNGNTEVQLFSLPAKGVVTGIHLDVTSTFVGTGTDGAWTSSNNLNTARKELAGCGTQSSGLSFGGYTGSYSAVTEEYDGSCWSSSNNLNTARNNLAGCGTQSSGLSFGGYNGSVNVGTTEEYDGSCWTSSNNLNTTRRNLAGCGTQSSGLSFGGTTGSVSAVTEEYDGSCWSSSNNLNTARDNLAGCGTQSSGLSFGGNTSSASAVTEEYDKQIKASIGIASDKAKYKTSSSLSSTGLKNEPYTTNDEMLNTSSSTNIKLYNTADGVWTASNNLNTARKGLAGCGTQLSGLSFGGDTGSDVGTTEEYDGSCWTSSNNLNTARKELAGCGTQSSGLSFGGYNGSNSSVTEEYDGSCWTASNNLNTARRYLTGCGTQSSGLSFGGVTSSNSAVTEEYDGSCWTSSNNLNTARRALAGCGTQSSGLSFGGHTGSDSAVTEEYDGSCWSSSNNLNTARRNLAGCGTQSSGLSFGGYTSSYSAVTEEYDGSCWSSSSNLNTAREYLAGCGTQSSGLSFGGYSGSNSAVTEEYDKGSWTGFTAGELKVYYEYKSY